MNRAFHWLVCVALSAAACACGVRADAPATTMPAPTLAAGTSLTVTFPEMPRTYYAIESHKDVAAKMTVFLPRNYDPAHEYPLLVFLDGGNGGDGSSPAVARALCDDRDFICLAVPLFKSVDPKSPGGEIIMRDADAAYMWPYFQQMLTKLRATVPNINRDHEVLGGFSNGAHAAQGLIDVSDGAITREFSAFFFVEGGGRLEHYDLLKGKPFLMVSSSAGSQPRAAEICDQGKAAGAQARLLVVDVGKHAFPAKAYPAVRDWLRQAVGQ